LADVENIDGSEPVQRALTFGCCVITRFVGRRILRPSSCDHRGENENALFSPFNEAAKRVPCSKPGNEEDYRVQKKLFAKDLAMVQEMNALGIHIMAGTDTPNPYVFPGFGLHDASTEAKNQY
jgi:hypothetical protein